MRHLGDGAIAEFLDEAVHQRRTWRHLRRAIEDHLEACADCRARVEAVRARRERAHTILGRGAPDAGEPPPFAEIAARARGAARRGRGFPYRAVALAAAVAVVAGVTWVVTLQEELPSTPDRMERRADPAGTAEATDAGPDRRGEPPTRERQPPAPTTPPAATPEPDRARRLAQAVEEAPPTALAAPVPDTAVPQAAERAAFEVQDRREALPSLARSAVPADGWRAVSREEATRILGTAPASIPGLPVLAYHVPFEPARPTVQTTQALDATTQLSLLQEPGPLPPDTQTVIPGAAMDAVGENPVNAVSVPFDGFVVTGRARLPVDSLRALLARLRR